MKWISFKGWSALSLGLTFATLPHGRVSAESVHDVKPQKQSESVLISAPSPQDDLDIKSVRVLVEASQFPQALEQTKKIYERTPSPELKTLLSFLMGVLAHENGQYVDSERYLVEALAQKTRLEDHALFYLAKTWIKLDKSAEAQKALNRILKIEPKSSRLTAARRELARLAMQEKKWGEAYSQLAQIEKKSRSQTWYPEVLYDLLKLDLQGRRRGQTCKWARKLYTKYPAHPVVSHWGVDLHLNEIEDKRTGCPASPKDQRAHLKALQFGGQADRARKEIDVLVGRAGEFTKYHAESLLASYLIDEGYVAEALKILSPHYDSQKRNSEYLMLLGKAAVRSGEFQIAISSYDQAAALSPGSRKGKNALFLAAGVSFQAQDYDGAVRRFEQFSGQGGLGKDAAWYMAFIKYMRGDYVGAIKGLVALKPPRRSRRSKPSGYSTERTKYWIAMSLMKMNRPDQARVFFEKLAADKSFGYYAIASRARLESIEKKDAKISVAGAEAPKAPVSPLPLDLLKGLGLSALTQGTERTTADTKATLTASAESNSDDEDESTISEEGEDTAAADKDPDDATDSDDSSETADAEGATGGPDAEDPQLLGLSTGKAFRDPRLLLRFMRANELLSVGLKEWAKWELNEIEKKTSNREYLRMLMAHYESANDFYRSSYLGEVNFGMARTLGGIQGARDLWVKAFPRAFESQVTMASRNFNIPFELIWSIMRAESHYRTEALSPVGAVGLMQVMPFTANRVAKLLGMNEFSSADLAREDVNIRIGARYLAKLMRQFGDRIPLTAAAYNAGPHRVEAWVKYLSQVEMDEFVEHIPYMETRNYVKKVVSNFTVYSNLYSFGAVQGGYRAPAWMTEPVGVTINGPLSGRESWDQEVTQ